MTDKKYILCALYNTFINFFGVIGLYLIGILIFVLSIQSMIFLQLYFNFSATPALKIIAGTLLFIIIGGMFIGAFLENLDNCKRGNK